MIIRNWKEARKVIVELRENVKKLWEISTNKAIKTSFAQHFLNEKLRNNIQLLNIDYYI